MIVITDGESHDSPDLEKVIEDSEKDNVTRYAVAVSDGAGILLHQTYSARWCPVHPDALGLAAQPTSTALRKLAGALGAGPAFAGGGGVIGSGFSCWGWAGPNLPEGCPAWAAGRNYSSSLLLGLLPQWDVQCLLGLLPYGHPSGALGQLCPSALSDAFLSSS